MSSTSSCECRCSECFKYAACRDPNNGRRATCYQTLGQPLIYYAQIPRPKIWQRNKNSRKDKPNCFVKAFKWYTQDHYPIQSRELPNDHTHQNGFAMWLDRKYDEFMIDRRAEEDDPQIHTPTVQLDKRTAHTCSPLKYRRPTAFVKECGDTPNETTNQSFEYIMKPKEELSRPASEFCLQNTSTDTHTSKKTITKTKAPSSERSVFRNTPAAVEENDRNLAPSSTKTSMTKSIKYSQKSTICPSHKKNLTNLACQCPEEVLVTSDEQTQCECEISEMVIEPSSVYDCCPNCRETRPALKSCAHPSQVSVTETEFCSSTMTKKCGSQFTHTIKVSDKEVGNQHGGNDNNGSCCSTVHHDDLKYSNREINQVIEPMHTQLVKPCYCSKEVDCHRPPFIRRTNVDREMNTSDHSIILEKDTYPLFMKIICADKLNEDVIRK